MGIVLKGGTIVSSKDSYIADIRIENGIIKAMGENLEVDGDEVINVSGRYILPGGIDAHTHFDLDVGVTRTADNFETGTKAALVGGTTTIIDYANHIKGQRF
ncbi:MAG: amidohydrolase family protein, partial [Clostridium sp.]|nr:amidohydrolase family protein [Clostridium sp.]MDU2852203.1 amidohydrolase family protein [Clostridium sp.]